MSNVIGEMASVFGESVGGDIASATEYSRRIFTENAEMLEEIAELFREGELTEEEFEEELDDQREALEAQLLAVVVMGKAAVQKAMDGALNVFKKSVGFPL